MKVCFAASMGGHLEEIEQLKALCGIYDSFLITEKNDFQHVAMGRRTYFLPHLNRKEKGFLPAFFRLFVTAWKILREERPDYVISTGALITYPVSVVAKIMGIRVIYIVSFARIDTLSMTGKLMYPIADLYIVQSLHLKEQYKKAIYGGCIF